MHDSLSRFQSFDPFEGHPGLAAKVTRALRSRRQATVKLTSVEADFLITEGGGPDPDHAVPTQMFTWHAGGKLNAVTVKGGDNPRCWRL